MMTAQEMLTTYQHAEIAVLQGQSFRFGERMLTRADLAEIRKGRQEWQAAVDREAGAGRRARWATVDFGGRT
ncbi:primosomal replication protein PriB/PriC domain protein [Xanthomonas campestris pv. zingibericola]|uniref:primosomal replication protein PriB/PriC domain protein n=1 Tax=Xanthomonas euvesicatoria TaxID=456327 RepID=UPI001C45E714|nr:primosomal replication protein PriB/PriC domain protein [Xanthomonas euvesicatoria]MBV6857229.1 primosomal replication protein PriB/PriC domain protein [Xanthomonas campestris pv. zingibericola]